MVTVGLAVKNSVYPSAGALATACAAIVPLAPPRFSTTTDWSSRRPRCCAYSRATISTEPPGE